jgi:hypothetical protein
LLIEKTFLLFNGEKDEEEEVSSYKMTLKKTRILELERGSTIKQSPRNFP